MATRKKPTKKAVRSRRSRSSGVRAGHMQAAVLAELRKVELIEMPTPKPGRGEVLLEVEAVGICGSDLHYWRHGRIADQVVTFPMRLGHEPAGRVAGLGPGVKELKEGQRVAVEPGVHCGTCRECQMGRVNLCPNVIFLGTPPVDGAFQRYLRMPASALVPLPSKVDAALGATAEPLGVALHSFDLVNLRAGECVAVIGAGSVGLCVVALAQQLGARVVVVAEPRPFRRKVAKRLGAEKTVSANPDAFVEAAHAATEGHGVDVVFECSGAPEALNTALVTGARGGRVAMIGIPEVDTLTIDPHKWRKRELAVVNVRRSNRTLERCLRILERTDLGLKKSGFLSKPVGLQGVQDAMVDLDNERSELVKVMVDPRL